MRRWVLRTAGALGLGSLVACSAVLGVDDFDVRSPSVDAGQDAGDSGGTITPGDGGTDGGVDANPTDTGAIDSGPDAPANECTVNKDCDVKGDNFICRKTDFKCVALLSAECTHIKGDYKNDNAIIIGSILPTAGADLTSGLPEQNAIDLAIDEFASVSNLPAVPGSTARRPLVLVGCNDNSENAQAITAAKHLVNDVKVPAIIGAAFSGITLKVANEVTIPSNTFLISPSATSVALTDLNDKGLVWRTIASDNIQADAHASFYPLLEAKIQNGDATRKVKVAIANKGDAYGQGLAEALSTKLKINGAKFLDASNVDNRVVTDFGDPDGATPPDYATSIKAVTDLEPDVVYLMGTTEVITQMLKGIEENWPAATTRPYYLLADGALVAELPAYVTTLKATDAVAAENLRLRIMGTVPGTTSDIFTKFKTRYESVFHDNLSSTSGVSNAYDALYNIAYALVAMGGKAVTGPNIAGAFSSLVATGVPVTDTGASKITAAFTTLQAGNKIDYNGASGPLDYDLATGEAPADIQVWCLPKNATGDVQPGTGTSVIYDATTKTLKGTFATLTTDCKW